MEKTLYRILLACLCLLADPVFADGHRAIVLVLDDMGNSLPLGQRALQLPGPINYAFLPHRANSVTLAQRAHALNKEVLLHAPMSNVHNKPLGEGALTPQMNQQDFIAVLEASIDSVPYVQGVNNHMGSLLTQMPRQMGWLMSTLKKRQLYFIDSRTSAGTAAESTAVFHQLPNLRRHVFLDNERDVAAIENQFEHLLRVAANQPVTVAIGHPYPETLDVLQRQLPTLQLRGFHLALASTIMKRSNCLQPDLVDMLLKQDCTNAGSPSVLAALSTPVATIN